MGMCVHFDGPLLHRVGCKLIFAFSHLFILIWHTELTRQTLTDLQPCNVLEIVKKEIIQYMNMHELVRE
jgi:hypothetical protein